MTGLFAPRLTELTAGPAGADTLVVGPSLGTAVRTLWASCAALLGDTVRVVGWDLPGHGTAAPADGPISIHDLAGGVRSVVDADPTIDTWHYAGVSIAGEVGLALAEIGDPASVSVICSSARIGTAESWAERADTVRAEGTGAMVDGSRQRWFAPATLERDPAGVTALLEDLRATDDASYSWLCGALGAFDARESLVGIAVPTLAIAGAQDGVCPPEDARRIAEGVRTGRSSVIEDVAHLAPFERPAATADLLRDHVQRTSGT